MDNRVDEDKVESNGHGKGVIEVDAMEVLLDVPSRQNIETTVSLTRRTNDGGKKRFVVAVKAIGGDRYKDIQEQCTERRHNRRTGTITQEFDARKSQKLVILECVTKPDLRDAKLQGAYNVNASIPEDIVDKVFLPGEIDKLSDEILDISGYNEEVLDKVKVS